MNALMMEIIVQVFPKKLFFLQQNYHVPEQVVNTKTTIEENIDILIDETASIQKAVDYIKKDIILFSLQRLKLNWPPSAQDSIS